VLFRQPGANIIGTVDRVRALLPQLQAAVPPSIHIEPVVDRTTTIRASVYDVERTLAISIGLVILVVFLFLRSAWATVIPSVAIAISLAVSLTTTPMMCAKFLVAESERKHGRFYRWSERAFERLRNGYEHALDFVLANTLPVLLVTFATIGFTIYLYVVIPKGFFPQQDTGRLSGNVPAAQDTSFPALIEKLNLFMQVVRKDPAVENVVSFTGGGRGGGNTASMFVSLKP